MLFENLREELMFYDGAFRAIMIVKPMSDEFRIVFQNALDSIAYILKSQTNWLDDQYVSMGFQNIENAKALLMYLVDEGNLSEEKWLIDAKVTIGKTKGLHPMPNTLLTQAQREKVERLKAIARKAIDEHNDKQMPKSTMSGSLGHKAHGASMHKTPTTIANEVTTHRNCTIGWKSSKSKSLDTDDEDHDGHNKSVYRGRSRGYGGHSR